MLKYSVKHIAGIINAENAGNLCDGDAVIEHVLYDSRKLLYPEKTLFFALHGLSRDGDGFIDELIQKGVQNFVVNNSVEARKFNHYPNLNFLLVENVLYALQQLAKYHRLQFKYPVIAITGSNGKTIVKEWLYQCLLNDFSIVRSPKSYNSQIGVPVSVLEMGDMHNLALFEAGISTTGEMERLYDILQPEVGIFTMIGSAHEEGFGSRQEKLREKLKLFLTSKVLVFSSAQLEVVQEIQDFLLPLNPSIQLFDWGYSESCFLQVVEEISEGEKIELRLKLSGSKEFSVRLSFSDKASVHNSLTVITALLSFGIPAEKVIELLKNIRPVEMRLEMLQGINNCSVINDSYSADLLSLVIATDFLQQQKQHDKRTIILSDFAKENLRQNDYQKIADVINNLNLYRFIGIGPELCENAGLFNTAGQKQFYLSTDAFIPDLPAVGLKDETILVKGARHFQFERVVSGLIQKTHQTVLEINLSAIRQNLNVYRKMLAPGVKIMVMVKAFSYGSGSFEIANLLQHAGVDYLGVAYADEAVALRKAGISLPIMVMNVDEFTFHQLIAYNLEPEIFSLRLLNLFVSFLKERNISGYPIHLKVDTGMHRLGFGENDLHELKEKIKGNDTIFVKSVFSHLAGSDSPGLDDFTAAQVQRFSEFSQQISGSTRTKPLRHICNSSAIFRFPQYHFDMVRLGIGIYGFDANREVQEQLKTVTTLKTTVAQIRNLKAGETIGYGRKGILHRDSVIATVRLGYADGYGRNLGNGNAYMMVNGEPAPTVGNICMDMTMLDVTGIEVQEEDQVTVFGEELSAEKLAEMANTIPYEMLTSVSQRVQRLYFEE